MRFALSKKKRHAGPLGEDGSTWTYDGFAGGKAESVGEVLRTSLAHNTRLAYRTGWERFVAYCKARGKEPLNAEPKDVADFLVRLASQPRSPKATTRPGEPLAPGTIGICVSAINRRFRERNLASPASNPGVAAVLKALRRRSDGPGRQVKALREYEIAAILEHCDALGRRQVYRLIAARDAAVIAVGFAGALRRSEICALRFKDVEFIGGPDETAGMYLHIRRSKTDQYAGGQRVAIPDGELIQPVSRIHRWLTLSGIDQGPVFQTMWRGGHLKGRALSRSDVPRLVKRYVRSIGLDPAEYSGHSLRAGFVTSAAAHHARLDKIMEVTRHRNAGMVLRYIRQADAFEDHAGEDFL